MALGIVGRPSIYTPELAQLICKRLTDGVTLLEICRDETMPHISTIMDWSKGTVSQAAEFPEMYARARRIQLARMAEEIQLIADDCSNDYMDRQLESGAVRVVDHEHVKRSELRIKTRQWALSKLEPQTYGDRIAHQMLDEHGKPARAGVTVIIDGAPGGDSTAG